MKKLLVIIVASVALQTTSAQDLRIGVKGAFNSTWLFNNNVSDAGESADYQASWGSHMGLAINYYFTDNLGVSLDLLYATHTQRFYGVYANAVAGYAAEEILTYLDVPILFRVSSEGGPYVEIGPQLGFLLGAKEDFYSAGTFPFGLDHNGFDSKKDFNSINVAAVLGFGYDISVTDNFLINIGLRFGYGLTDVTKEYTESELISRAASSPDNGNYVAFTHLDNNYDINYKQTSRAFGGLMIGFIYKPD